MHLLAPGLAPVLVTEPAAHSAQPDADFVPVPGAYLPASHAVHAATFDAVEYFPASQVVHSVAAPFVPVFVMEPAAQVEHLPSDG